jgi:hypothetical protein
MAPVNRRAVEEEGPLAVAALFAFVWAVVRALVQSITLDEADTYFWFASMPAAYIWHPFPNNHVLNTLLMWVATHGFGASILAVRAPALLGAILYISTCYFLCRNITNQLSLRLPLFICLTFNPFVFDFMVVARGYGLANAFLLAAIAIPLWHGGKGGPSLRMACALASVALGLSFAASFSFAFVDLAAFIAIVTWAVRRRGAEPTIRIIEFCVLPGLFVALVLGGYPLAYWPKGELWYGAQSLGEMTQSMTDASLYQLNPKYLAVELFDVLNFLKPLLLPLLAILCAGQLVATRLDGSWLQDARARSLGRFAAAIAGILTLSILMSWLAFRFYKLPLPMTRTGVFLIPLCTLLAGVIAAAPTRSLVSRWLRHGIAAVFICLAGYYLFCLRMTYFKEYEYDADVKGVYSVLAKLNHRYGVSDVVAHGLYLSPLNFYRILSKRETFPEFIYPRADSLPTGKSIYVLHGPFYRPFIEKEHLVVIYQGPTTDVVVAVRSDGPIPLVKIDP